MILAIETSIDYALAGRSSLILQIEAAEATDQHIHQANIRIGPHSHFARLPLDQDLGERLMIESSGPLTAHYTARIEITRPEEVLVALPATPVHLLPGEAVPYLMGSRFCPSESFQSYVAAEFGGFSGGALIAALAEWIGRYIAYVPGTSHGRTTALETFVERRGVCRDFAHLLITLARAGGIPARMASAYAPRVTPQDFHAVAEVYLGGGWHMVDATGMARPGEMARISTGRDAADVAFLTCYGLATLRHQSVSVCAQ